MPQISVCTTQPNCLFEKLRNKSVIIRKFKKSHDISWFSSSFDFHLINLGKTVSFRIPSRKGSRWSLMLKRKCNKIRKARVKTLNYQKLFNNFKHTCIASYVGIWSKLNLSKNFLKVSLDVQNIHENSCHFGVRYTLLLMHSVIDSNCLVMIESQILLKSGSISLRKWIWLQSIDFHILIRVA